MRRRSFPARAALLPRVLVLLLCLAAGLPAQAAQPLTSLVNDSGDKLSVSVLTFGPGELYWQRFGHNAILIRDTATGEEPAFNYGIFDFGEKDFMLNFVRGYMMYRMVADDVRADLRMYSEEHRWVQEQRLNLLPAQKEALRDFLIWNVQPENARYRYDYFTSNCSTRVRDALDRALGGSLRPQIESRATPYTYRFDGVRLVSPTWPLGELMDLALGPTADRPINLWQESFVPMVLMEALRGAHTVDAGGRQVPLVAEDRRVIEADYPGAPLQPPDLRMPLLLGGLALGTALLLLGRARQRAAARALFALTAVLVHLVCGICGLILLALWTLTQHWAGWHNENLLLLSPLCLLLLPACATAFRPRWTPGAWALRIQLVILAGCVAALGLRLIPGCYQGNLQWIGLILPIHLALSLVFLRTRAAAPAAGSAV